MFTTVLSNVGIILLYMLLGFLVAKGGKVNPAHAKSLSGILLFVLCPCMILNSFIQMEYTHESMIKLGIFAAVTFVIQIAFMFVLYIFLKRRYTDAKYRILTVGSVLGNVGFFGMPVLSGIFPNDPIVICYSSINVVTMNLIVFTMGVFLITNNRKFISIKSAILNPTTLAVLASLPLFIFRVDFPDIVDSSISLLGRMVTPMCMIILGIRLSTVRFRDLFSRPFVYITCLLKLVIFPLFAFACVRWLPFMDEIAKGAVFVLAATPSGAVIESLAELHECEQELSANVVLLTTLLCLFTMPVVLLLL